MQDIFAQAMEHPSAAPIVRTEKAAEHRLETLTRKGFSLIHRRLPASTITLWLSSHVDARLQVVAHPEEGSDKVRVDLDEEVAVMTLCRKPQLVHLIRESTERPLDIPAGPASVVIVGGTIVAQRVAAVIELPAGHPTLDLCDLPLTCNLMYS